MMLAQMQSPPDPVQEKVLARMSAILDDAAEKEGVSPEEFRRALTEAQRYAEGQTDAPSPETFVLSVLGQLF